MCPGLRRVSAHAFVRLWALWAAADVLETRRAWHARDHGPEREADPRFATGFGGGRRLIAQAHRPAPGPVRHPRSSPGRVFPGTRTCETQVRGTGVPGSALQRRVGAVRGEVGVSFHHGARGPRCAHRSGRFGRRCARAGVGSGLGSGSWRDPIILGSVDFGRREGLAARAQIVSSYEGE